MKQDRAGGSCDAREESPSSCLNISRGRVGAATEKGQPPSVGGKNNLLTGGTGLSI